MEEKRRFFLVDGLPVFQSKRDRQITLDQMRLYEFGIDVGDKDDKNI